MKFSWVAHWPDSRPSDRISLDYRLVQNQNSQRFLGRIRCNSEQQSALIPLVSKILETKWNLQEINNLIAQAGFVNFYFFLVKYALYDSIIEKWLDRMKVSWVLFLSAGYRICLPRSSQRRREDKSNKKHNVSSYKSFKALSCD